MQLLGGAGNSKEEEEEVLEPCTVEALFTGEASTVTIALRSSTVHKEEERYILYREGEWREGKDEGKGVRDREMLRSRIERSIIAL